MDCVERENAKHESFIAACDSTRSIWKRHAGIDGRIRAAMRGGKQNWQKERFTENAANEIGTTSPRTTKSSVGEGK